MMGFALLLTIGAAAFAGLRLLGLPRVLGAMAGAALMLGAAGYAWQGSPGLAASPARPQTTAVELEPGFVDLRDRLVGRFSAEHAYFVWADAMLRTGNSDAAARVLLGGANALPDDFLLWAGAGDAIARRDGAVTPAAELAFRRAFQLAPAHPAPPFFLGVAHARDGDLARASRAWRRAALLSPDGSVRTDLARLGMAAEAAAGR